MKDRDLSILEFNMRVFKQVYSDDVPLMEKINFIYIAFKNIDEFISVRLPEAKEKRRKWYIHTIENIYSEMNEALCEILKLPNLIQTPWDNDILTGRKRITDGGICFVYYTKLGEWGVVPYNGNEKLLMNRINLVLQGDTIKESFYVRFISDKSFRYIYTGESVTSILEEIKDVVEIKKSGDFNYVQTNCQDVLLFTKFLKYMNMPDVQWIYTEEPLIKCEYLIKKLKQDNTNPDLYYPKFTPYYEKINYKESLLDSDTLIHNPYADYQMVLDFIDQMCTDEDTVAIFISLYRMAKKSKIIESLIKAKRLGKDVYAYIEVTARGNEDDNVRVIERLMAEGIHVSCNYFNYKVHAKLFCAINKSGVIYTHIGTGNYNEDTAKIYTDYHLLTTNPSITIEVFRVFRALFERRMYVPQNKKSLIAVSPVTFRSKIIDLINDEIRKGEYGKIFLKCNSLCDSEIIDKLYSAAELGVKVDIICRTGCSITAHPNITIKSKVGRFLEHDRVYVFGKRVFISSADLLLRNISKRVELLCEINTPELKDAIINILNSIWNDRSVYVLLENGRWDRLLDSVSAKKGGALEDA